MGHSAVSPPRATKRLVRLPLDIWFAVVVHLCPDATCRTDRNGGGRVARDRHRRVAAALALKCCSRDLHAFVQKHVDHALPLSPRGPPLPALISCCASGLRSEVSRLIAAHSTRGIDWSLVLAKLRPARGIPAPHFLCARFFAVSAGAEPSRVADCAMLMCERVPEFLALTRQCCALAACRIGSVALYTLIEKAAATRALNELDCSAYAVLPRGFDTSNAAAHLVLGRAPVDRLDALVRQARCNVLAAGSFGAAVIGRVEMCSALLQVARAVALAACAVDCAESMGWALDRCDELARDHIDARVFASERVCHWEDVAMYASPCGPRYVTGANTREHIPPNAKLSLRVVAATMGAFRCLRLLASHVMPVGHCNHRQHAQSGAARYTSSSDVEDATIISHHWRELVAPLWHRLSNPHTSGLPMPRHRWQPPLAPDAARLFDNIMAIAASDSNDDAAGRGYGDIIARDKTHPADERRSQSNIDKNENNTDAREFNYDDAVASRVRAWVQLCVFTRALFDDFALAREVLTQWMDRPDRHDQAVACGALWCCAEAMNLDVRVAQFIAQNGASREVIAALVVADAVPLLALALDLGRTPRTPDRTAVAAERWTRYQWAMAEALDVGASRCASFLCASLAHYAEWTLADGVCADSKAIPKENDDAWDTLATHHIDSGYMRAPLPAGRWCRMWPPMPSALYKGPPLSSSSRVNSAADIPPMWRDAHAMRSDAAYVLLRAAAGAST